MDEEHFVRRLAAIFYADVEGYSRLTGEDEEGTHRIVAEYLDVMTAMIATREGRVVHYAGDAVLACFDSVLAAVTCAIEVQKELARRSTKAPVDRKVRFRIGVNLGDVIVDRDDIYGNGVNVAARLESLAEPGGICISSAVLEQVRGKFGNDVEFDDMGLQQVKNIDRPIQVFRIHSEGTNSAEGRPSTKSSRRGRVHLLFAVTGMVILALGIAIAWRVLVHEPAPPGFDQKGVDLAALEQRPLLIVLPFINLSGEPTQDYFSDGFTEDITTGLARIPRLLVVARNTAFTLKGKSVDARTLGQQFGVRYMLEGSARQQNGRLRINAQLIETAGGTHVWAERFDRPMTDIFIVQDALVDRIVGTVAASLRRHERQRAISVSSDTLAAYDLTLRARLLFRRNTVTEMTEARALLHRANKIDPEYAAAFSVLAQVEQFFFTSRVSNEYAREETALRVIDAAARAVALSPEDAFAHAVHGMSLRLKSDYDGASREAKLARELAPNDPEVLATVSTILLSVGDYQNSVDTMQLAWMLDPYLSPVFTGAVLAQGLFALGDYAGSVAVARNCLDRVPEDVRCWESLARATGELGRHDEAREAVHELMRLSPNYSVSEYTRRAKKNRRDMAAIERWAKGLEKAGVPP